MLKRSTVASTLPLASVCKDNKWRHRRWHERCQRLTHHNLTFVHDSEATVAPALTSALANTVSHASKTEGHTNAHQQASVACDTARMTRCCPARNLTARATTSKDVRDTLTRRKPLGVDAELVTAM